MEEGNAVLFDLLHFLWISDCIFLCRDGHICAFGIGGMLLLGVLSRHFLLLPTRSFDLARVHWVIMRIGRLGGAFREIIYLNDPSVTSSIRSFSRWWREGRG
jgi:hypothetical protein